MALSPALQKAAQIQYKGCPEGQQDAGDLGFEVLNFSSRLQVLPCISICGKHNLCSWEPAATNSLGEENRESVQGCVDGLF